MKSAFFLTRWFFLAMRAIYNALCNALTWDAAYVIVLTILLFTVAIRLITVFSDVASRKSSAKMQAIQPDLQKLQKKYGNDPQRMNVEQKKLMTENGVSMFGGCLPLLFTLPLFFIFISAFRAWSNEQTLHLLLTVSEEGVEAGKELLASYKFIWINNIWRPDNLTSSVVLSAEEFWTIFAKTKSTVVSNFIYFEENQAAFEQLLQNLHFFDADMNIVSDNTAFIAAYNEFFGPIMQVYESRVNGFAILPVVAGATSFLQSWIMMKNQPAQSNDAAGSTGKTMMYMMPLMTVFFCWKYDATFSFYWMISNLVSIAVTMVVNKKMPEIMARDAQKQAEKKAKRLAAK